MMIDRIKNSLDSAKELLIIYIVSATLVSILFSVFEGRDIFNSYWWTFITGLTIGYGDIYPATIAGKVLAIVWAHFMAFIFIPVAVGYVVVNMIKNKDEWTDKEQREMMSILRDLNEKDKSNE